MPAPANNVDASRNYAMMIFPASILAAFVVPSASALTVLRGRQAPGPKPQYVDYGEPGITTFNNLSSACMACMEFYPEKQDGQFLHSKKYKDVSGGVWQRSCRAGKCDFRDPQTEPVGGIIGRGVGPGGAPDGKFCITRDPVMWYSDCEPLIFESAATLLDVTRYCSYQQQIFIPPPPLQISRFAGKPQSWARIGGSKEQCLVTIQKQGAALYDDMNFCDANLPALSGCCETVYSALECVASTAFQRGVPKKGKSILSDMSYETKNMLKIFEQYCVPLCLNDQPHFCKKYPTSDICVKPVTCTECTKKGGKWCPKLKSCHCGPKPPCIAPPIETPLQCAAEAFKFTPTAKPAAAMRKEEEAASEGEALCKYAKMAREWKGRQ